MIAVLFLLSLAVTVAVGVTGVSPTAGKAGLIAVIVCLALFTVLTILAVFLFDIGGGLPHKIGFYVMHAGAVILMVGFMLTGLTGATNARTYVDENGAERTLQGDFYAFASPVDSVKVGNREFVPSGCFFEVGEVQVKNYPDGTPREYSAVVRIIDADSGVGVRSALLRVNHPQYMNGYKLYLMSIEGSGIVVLIKFNPGEYPVLVGIALLVSGAFLSCMTGYAKRRKKGSETP